MKHQHSIFPGTWVSLLLFTAVVTESAQPFVNFEGKQTNPIRVSPDGTRLFAVNTPDARISVFDTSEPAHPRLVAEIPVGLEPVSLNPRSNDEVWVVNEVSDSVSIVSVSRGAVLDTLRVKDEPMDVVFAGGRAFVSVGRGNAVVVFDLATREELTRIPLQGLNPRALAVSPDGDKVYVAFALSGNRTTVVPKDKAPEQPPPTNIPNSPPEVALIVDAEDAAWTAEIPYTMPDNDAAEIDVSSLTVTRYFRRLGTVNLGLGVNPSNGDLWVANTEARNLVSFEPNLRSYTHFNRVTRVNSKTGESEAFDLNPGVDYGVLPNPSVQATALAIPTSVVFDPSGEVFYVAAFGSDRVARCDVSGNVLERIEVSDVAGAEADPRNKRGPRGLALHPTGSHLYVMNRIANTLTVIETGGNSVMAEIPAGSHDPTPEVIRRGRGFLYDARLSGNGTMACASCHVDAELDHLAWNLGDPGGQMQTLTVTMNGQTLTTVSAHPMKGPMTTQTLRGLKGVEPLHWRGDRVSFLDFNPAFASLMGGNPLSPDDMQLYKDFVETIVFAPNPNRNLDNTYPARVGPGDPLAGDNYFHNTAFFVPAVGQSVTCTACHSDGTGVEARSNFRIAQSDVLDLVQPVKIPHLRNMYKKDYFDNGPGAETLAGFGFEHDGAKAGLIQAHTGPRFETIQNNVTAVNNLAAFLLCFDTGTPPAVGHSLTLSADTLALPEVVEQWDTMEQLADAGNIDLIAKGDEGGVVYDAATHRYHSDSDRDPIRTRAWIESRVTAGAVVTLMGVPAGSGLRMGIDRDMDGAPDGFRPTLSVPASTTVSGEASFQFMLGGPAGVEVQLQRGDEVGNWEDWTVLTIGDVPTLVTDPDISERPRQFYRALTRGNSPWRFATVTGVTRSSRLYIFLNKAGVAYIDDLRLVSGVDPGAGENHVRGGDFEMPLGSFWTVPANYDGTTVSGTMAFTGHGSLNLVANGTPGGAANVLTHEMLSITTNTTYTLSYWYLPGTNDLRLTVRTSDNTLNSTVELMRNP